MGQSFTYMERRNKMMKFEILFITQMILGIIMFVLWIQFMQMKRMVEKIIKEIEAYISFVTEEAEVEDVSIEKNIKKSLTDEKVLAPENKRINKRQSKDDAQTQLIQAVLGEYFP